MAVDLLRGIPSAGNPAVDEADYLASLERARADTVESPCPGFDPQQAKEFAAEAVRGRKIEDFHQALQHCGFRRYHPHQLPPMESSVGPQLHREARWVNLRDAYRWPDIRMAMTDDQIVAWFPGGPVEFWSWYQTALARVKAKEMGLVLPKSFRVEG